MAWHDLALLDMALRGMAWRWLGMVWLDLAWLGMILHGVGKGVTWHAVVCRRVGLAWHGMAWPWLGMAWRSVAALPGERKWVETMKMWQGKGSGRIGRLGGRGLTQGIVNSRNGVAWHAFAWRGLALRGVAWRGEAWRGRKARRKKTQVAGHSSQAPLPRRR